MVFALKLRKIGNSVGLILPKEAMAKLNVQEGDTLALTDGPDGGMYLLYTGKSITGLSVFILSLGSLVAAAIWRKQPKSLPESSE